MAKEIATWGDLSSTYFDKTNKETKRCPTQSQLYGALKSDYNLTITDTGYEAKKLVPIVDISVKLKTVPPTIYIDGVDYPQGSTVRVLHNSTKQCVLKAKTSNYTGSANIYLSGSWSSYEATVKINDKIMNSNDTITITGGSFQLYVNLANISSLYLGLRFTLTTPPTGVSANGDVMCNCYKY